MATLPIIPRNDGEGSLGIETKQWGDIQTKKINGVEFENKMLGTSENELENIQTKKINNQLQPIINNGDKGKVIIVNIEENGYALETIQTFVDPDFETVNANEINYNTATLRGKINYFGSIPRNQLITCFEWKEAGEIDWNTTTFLEKTTLGYFSEALTSLEPETEYEFRAVILDLVNPHLVFYGDTLSFTTEEFTATIIGVQDTGARGLDGATLKQVIYGYETESISETTLDTAYFDEHSKYQFDDWTDSDGNVFCEIPIAYWWRGNLPDVVDGTTPRWTMLMSDAPITVTINDTSCEFKASDATYKRGETYLDSFYIGKYRGHNAGDNKVGSKAGQTHWSNVTFDNFRTYCSNNGEGYHMLSLFEWHEILARMTIEKKTFQLMPESIRSTQGSCVYRGINDFCYSGSVNTEWMDGIRTNASGNYELWSTVGGSYVTTSNVAFNGSGESTYYSQSLFTGMDNLFIANVMGPNSTSFIPDFSGRVESRVSRVCYVCFCASSVYYGAFCSAFYYTSSEAHSSIGCRVAKW